MSDPLSKEAIERYREWLEDELLHSGRVSTDELYATGLALLLAERAAGADTRARTEEKRARLSVLSDAIGALQSLDDAGPELNAKYMAQMDELLVEYRQLRTELESIDGADPLRQQIESLHRLCCNMRAALNEANAERDALLQITDGKRDVACKLLSAAVSAQNRGVLAEVAPADLFTLIDGLPRAWHDVQISALESERDALLKVAETYRVFEAAFTRRENEGTVAGMMMCVDDAIAEYDAWKAGKR